ncbi:hypothetical protein JMN32_10320 [Fulvivirga sp. 29W222]|uniref:STAS/SEC14 domain-containing protein n=1 Tax=Fulvivirga marina TaxID=2494733 RepID=A0A937FY79_9BACT|nr:hypothetical protein [Fulvivirga marina]MBL6446708.1 hypothetical protein [Fulvivirga marina]
MSVTTIYTMGKSRIEYDPSVPCLIARHIGFELSHEHREFLNKGLELLIEKKKEQGKIAWVPDLRLSDAIMEEDSMWAVNDWSPRALAAGVKHVAFILSEDEFALASMASETYNDAIKNDEQMQVGNFRDEESAKEWLRESFSNEL